MQQSEIIALQKNAIMFRVILVFLTSSFIATVYSSDIAALDKAQLSQRTRRDDPHDTNYCYFTAGFTDVTTPPTAHVDCLFDKVRSAYPFHGKGTL